MKRVFGDFFHLFGNCILGFSFVFASFLLMINLYHSREIATVSNFSMSDYTLYNQFKEDVSDYSDKINNLKTNFVSSDSAVTYQLARDLISECITSIKDSAFYQLENKKSYSAYDIYLLNQDLNGAVNSKCFFPLEYTLKNQVKKIGYDRVPYEPVAKEIKIIGDELEFTTNYMRDRLLSNSLYHYSTDVTRTTIFDENTDQLFMIVNNYRRLTHVLDLVTDWYVSEFGGKQ